ncbi:S8 family peptidase [Hymenobacter caeli]|uniref:Subtilisin family serine protease n=1 Tax=Hymenobacter caeli TaxID=2735894 RepID=A0ABX2FR35_9BACT|nr:S8 family peptidase [Hymenobacter caeli]NRT19650.1 subtilisin family serine protease [Hymenobacter caeli]
MRAFWLRALALVGAVLLGEMAPAVAQGTVRRHLVYFRDKAGTPYQVGQPAAFLSARAVARRQRQGIAVTPRDLPVSPAYLAQVRAVAGAQVVYPSRWLNAVLVACDSAVLARVQALPAVRQATTLSRGPRPAVPPAAPTLAQTAQQTLVLGTRPDYGKTFAQDQLIGAVAMHDAGYRGEGMQIAVFDAGFPGADAVVPLQPVFAQQRVLGTRNFVDGGPQVYVRNSHGTNCFSLIGGEQAGVFVGTAPRASFHLCITEDANSERPVEEANWLAAAEYADSAGVDVISSSLGYTSFDPPAAPHTYADLDGRTAIGSQAAAIAARVGMLVVSAAGNEGASAWHYVSVPADADSIISVGAVDSLRRHASFSSYGPTADGRLKPTLAAMGVASAVVTAAGAVVRGSGTSYACPELAGLAAGLWQAHPRLSAQQIILALTRTASQATAPDNVLGYGVPDFAAADAYAATLVPPVPLGPPPARVQLYPNPTRTGQLLLVLPAELQGQALEVRIIDARGAVVRRQAVAPAGPQEISVSAGALAKGTYLCEVSGGGQKQVVRFVQQ